MTGSSFVVVACHTRDVQAFSLFPSPSPSPSRMPANNSEAIAGKQNDTTKPRASSYSTRRSNQSGRFGKRWGFYDWGRSENGETTMISCGERSVRSNSVTSFIPFVLWSLMQLSSSLPFSLSLSRSLPSNLISQLSVCRWEHVVWSSNIDTRTHTYTRLRSPAIGNYRHYHYHCQLGHCRHRRLIVPRSSKGRARRGVQREKDNNPFLCSRCFVLMWVERERERESCRWREGIKHIDKGTQHMYTCRDTHIHEIECVYVQLRMSNQR